MSESFQSPEPIGSSKKPRNARKHKSNPRFNTELNLELIQAMSGIYHNPELRFSSLASMMCKVLFMAHQRSPPLLVGFFEDTGESVYKHFRDDLLAPFLKTNELIQKKETSESMDSIIQVTFASLPQLSRSIYDAMTVMMSGVDHEAMKARVQLTHSMQVDTLDNENQSSYPLIFSPFTSAETTAMNSTPSLATDKVSEKKRKASSMDLELFEKKIQESLQNQAEIYERQIRELKQKLVSPNSAKNPCNYPVEITNLESWCASVFKQDKDFVLQSFQKHHLDKEALLSLSPEDVCINNLGLNLGLVVKLKAALKILGNF